MEWIQANPWVFGIGLLLAVVLVYMMIKRLFKIALLVLLLLVAILVWARMTGHKLPKDLERLSQQGQELLEDAVEQGSELIDEGKAQVGEVKKKVEDALDN